MPHLGRTLLDLYQKMTEMKHPQMDIKTADPLSICCPNCNTPITTEIIIKHTKWYKALIDAMVLFPYCCCIVIEDFAEHSCPKCKHKLATVKLGQ
jgi:hypothetical protein